MLRAPVNAVTVYGAKEGLHTDSRGYYIWPCEGVLTSYFGRRVSVGSSNHQGIDIANKAGTSVVAADSGDVVFAGWAKGYGNFIKLQHDNGEITCYGHLKEILVSEGDRVVQGDEIGLMGNTGISSGPHLHFEVRPDGEKQADPLKYLPERETN